MDFPNGWDLPRIQAHIAANLAVSAHLGLSVEAASPERALVRLNPFAQALRPGNIVSGPVMFAAADVAAYALILARTGDIAAVTIDLDMNFLRPATGLPLLAEAAVLRAGRRVFLCEVRISAPEPGSPALAHALARYAPSL